MASTTDAVAVTAPARSASNSVLVRMAEKFGMNVAAFEAVVRKTIMPTPDASHEHVAALLLVADQYGLNPLTKQIYAFPAKGGGITPIVGVDGWYFLAASHTQYDGDEQHVVHDEALGLGIETVIYRKDRGHPTRRTAWLRECKRNTEPWKMEMRMLSHKSFIQCARVAFALAGIVDPDEAERIAEAEVVEIRGPQKPLPAGGVERLAGALAPAAQAEPEREPGADEDQEGGAA